MRSLFILLGLSIALFATIVFFSAGSFMGLYYILWTAGFGGLLWKNRTAWGAWLRRLPGKRSVKFIGLGLLMIVIEETIAGLAMHLASAGSIRDLTVGIAQFYAFNLLALPGFIIGWYILLERYAYARKEVFILVGIFGLYAEKTLSHILAIPLMGALLVLPTMATYMLILAPSVMSHSKTEVKLLPPLVRYALGLVVPLAVSVPLVALVMYLRLQHPEYFPPNGFVQ